MDLLSLSLGLVGLMNPNYGAPAPIPTPIFVPSGSIYREMPEVYIRDLTRQRQLIERDEVEIMEMLSIIMKVIDE